MTSSELAALAESLGTLAGQIRGRASTFGEDVSAADTSLLRADVSWWGPRADGTSAAAWAYIDQIRPISAAVLDVATKVSCFATAASQYAGHLRTYETAIAAPADEVEGWARQAASRGRDGLVADWQVECVSHATGITTASEALETAYAATPGGFPRPAASGAAYYAGVIALANEGGWTLESLGLSAAEREAASDAVIGFASSGPIGDLIYTVIETANEGDIDESNDDVSMRDLDVTCSDPERVRDLVRQWAADHGLEFSEETVAVLATQIASTAWAMRRDPNEAWRETDDELDNVDAGASDAAALELVTSVAPIVGYDLARVHGDPNVTAQWWNATPCEGQDALAERNPAGFGNTDGLPAAVRNVANRDAMGERRAELELAQASGDLTESEIRELQNIERIEANIAENEIFEDRFTGEPAVVQLYVFEPGAFGGDGRAAIVVGDLDSADHVALAVPGFLSSVSGMDPGRVQELYEASRYATGGAETVAVVDWMGYDSPNPDVSNVDFDSSWSVLSTPSPRNPGELLDLLGEIWDGIGVADDTMARAGAELLATDVEAINAMRANSDAGDTHLTVIGNSYGSTTTGIAATEFGLAADEVVLSGSPGAGTASTAADFTTGTEHTWVASASSDAVTYIGSSSSDNVRSTLTGSPLGVDPADEVFGAHRIEAESVERSTPWPWNVPAEHGRYLDPNSESLYNISAIVTGDYEAVQFAEHRHQEPRVETHPPVADVDFELLSPDWDWTPFIDVDVQAPVEVNAWPDEPEGDRSPDEMSQASGEELVDVD